MSEEEFKTLVEQWEEETVFSIQVETSHPAFKKIVEAGNTVVPYILKLLHRRRSHIVAALPFITGENPIQKGHEGMLDLIIADWLLWGEERHILQ